MSLKKIYTNFIVKYPFFLLLIILVFVYFNSFNNGFVSFDDGGQVYKNTTIQNLNFNKLKILFTTSIAFMYQPLTSLSFAGITAIFGVKSATPFHVFSFLIHTINAFLVFCIGLKIFKSKIKSIFLASLFSLHPFAVEAISWVSATSTLLFSFFFLSALYTYIKYIEKRKRKYYVFSFTLFLIGCFCKVQIIPFVGILFLIDFLYKKPLLSIKNILLKIPFVVVAIVFVVVAKQFRSLESILPIYIWNSHFSSFYFSTHQLGWYLVKLFVPFNYSIVYNWPKELTLIHHTYTLASFLLVFLVYRFRKNKLFLFGISFFVMNIALHTALFSKILSPYAMRYTYISSLGIWIALLSFPHKRKSVYLGVIFLGILTFFAKKQTYVWENTKMLFESSLKVEPNNSLFHNNLGFYYMESNPKNAEKHLLKALELKPHYGKALMNLYNLLSKKDPQKVEEYYLKALKVQPNNANFYNNLGYLYHKTNFVKAEKYYLKALEINPNYANSVNNLNNLYKDKITPLELELKKAPNNLIIHNNLGFYYMRSNPQKAEKHLLRALQIKPNYERSLNNLNTLLFKTKPKKVEESYLKALVLEPNNTSYYNNLGYLYHNTNFSKAEKYYLKALEINPNYVISLNNIANLYKEIYPEKARKYFSKSKILNAK